MPSRLRKFDAVNSLFRHIDQKHSVELEYVGILEELPACRAAAAIGGGTRFDLGYEPLSILFDDRVGAKRVLTRFTIHQDSTGRSDLVSYDDVSMRGK